MYIMKADPHQSLHNSRGMLYISTSIWVLGTPNPGQNSHFQHFLQKTLKKQEICSNFLQKTRFFKFAPERWSTGKELYLVCVAKCTLAQSAKYDHSINFSALW